VTDLSQPKVLVVEDDSAKRYTIVRHLRRNGFVVDEAETGAEGLRRVQALPDIVILDVKLPDMSGFEVCESIKGNSVTRSVLVLELSARYVSIADRVYGLYSGADGYLTHPVDLGELVAFIHSLIRLRNAERLSARMAVEVEAGERRHRMVTDTVSVGLVQVDNDNRCTFLNPAAAAITGYTFEELTGQPLHSFLHGSDDQMACPESCALRSLASNGVVRDLRDQLRRKDGSCIPVRLSASPITENSQRCGTVIEIKDDRELMRAERTRDLFLAALGHDLRNPLNTVALGCHILESAELEPPSRNVLKRMVNGAKRMERLIQQMLFLAQSLVQSVPLEPADADLGSICDTLIDEFRERDPTCTIIRLGDEHVLGTWDSDRLSQLVDNLVTNALRHGDGDVSLTVVDEEQTAVLSVHNWGRPIAPAAIVTLFDPFRRAGGRTGGVGLGLYIVDQIARAHGGTIHVSSTDAEGTTFRVLLPKTPPPQALN
jgi:phosphoserine phosphatase RsbU/P